MLFILVEEKEMFDDDTFNGLGKRVFAGYWLLTGYCLEFTAIETIYKVTKKNTFFTKKSIAFHFVLAVASKKGYRISDDESCKMLTFVQKPVE